tara:strand:- start:16756 stop:17295 length:540 start_codon:yes stop_codon:yes gene_type:complete
MPKEESTSRPTWDAENETFQEFKQRRHAGWSGMGQKNSEKRQAGKCPNSNEFKNKCECRTCLNRRNRSKGRRKQNIARKKLGIKDNRFHGADAHEENWATGLRVEVKAGKQCNPLSTFFYKCKTQSDISHRAFGGMGKPFIQVSMPDNSTKGIVSFELDDIENVCVEVLKNFGYDFDKE